MPFLGSGSDLDACDTPSEGGDALVGLLLVELPQTITNKKHTQNTNKTHEKKRYVKGFERTQLMPQRQSKRVRYSAFSVCRIATKKKEDKLRTENTGTYGRKKTKTKNTHNKRTTATYNIPGVN